MKEAEEARVLANPPDNIAFTFDRYTGSQLTQLNNMQPLARNVETLLVLKNPGKEYLPLTRLMLKRASPQIPNVWNYGANLPPAMGGILFPIAQDTTLKSEASLFEKLSTSLSSIGIAPDDINLDAANAEAPFFSISLAITTKVLTSFVFMMPVDVPTAPSVQMPTTPIITTPTKPVEATIPPSPTPTFASVGSVGSSISLPPDAVSRREYEALLHQVSGLDGRMQGVDQKLTLLISRMTAQREPTVGTPVVPIDGTSAPATAQVVGRTARKRRVGS